MKITIKQILLIFTVLKLSSSIGIPLRRHELKCMIVYTVGQSESVKITARMPQLPDRQPEENYEIFIKNTQTNEEVAERLQSGVYKRQLSLTASILFIQKKDIIYEICFRIKSQREFGRVIIQYTAENLFNIQHSDIKVPANLLKSGDFKKAFEDAQRLFAVTQKFTDLQKVRKQTQSEVFVQTTQINTRLVYISIGEITIILAAGLYQFYSLQKYLAGKQYI